MDDALNDPQPTYQPVLDNFNWKRIQNLKIPFCIQFFLWKALHNGIPTKQNLWHGDDNWNTICPRCGEEDQTTTHALFFYNNVREFWALSNHNSDLRNWAYSDSMENVMTIFTFQKRNDLDTTILWRMIDAIMFVIWIDRNELVFNKVKPNPPKAIKIAMSFFLHPLTSPLPFIDPPTWPFRRFMRGGFEYVKTTDLEEAVALAVIRGMKAALQVGLERGAASDCNRLELHYRRQPLGVGTCVAPFPLLLHVARDSSVVDLQDVLLRMTHDTGFAMIFGRNPNYLSPSFSEDEFAEAIDVAAEMILFRHLVPSTWWKLLRLVNIRQERKYSKAWVTIDENVKKLIALKKEGILKGVVANDLFDLLKFILGVIYDLTLVVAALVVNNHSMESPLKSLVI
ncbi:hypothetical protein GIB67_019372 [Kingdonia uniflora]|uniref:Reverse transcriptase zinc-binding domain-containing protein n=1 Tax=Kingdonia uniflora TaxID=39325 RepID=A0A7J7M1T9_9MAGN|nr:hypothetical protein GIB67_019372 [Kingdonia uniflora]